jgi:hypothetical protein
VSLYRQPGAARARVIAIVAGVALLIGLGIGYALGDGGGEDPSASAVVDGLRADLRPVVNGLELLPNEYAQAFRGSGNEGAGVTGALGRIRAGLNEARPDLRVLAPAGTRELEAAVAALERAVRARRPPAEVGRLVRRASEALAAVPGGG